MKLEDTIRNIVTRSDIPIRTSLSGCNRTQVNIGKILFGEKRSICFVNGVIILSSKTNCHYWFDRRERALNFQVEVAAID